MASNLMHPCDFLTRALLDLGPWRRAAAPFAVIRVTGRDAGDFLQRLCSQDVLALPVGGLLPAAFLDSKGKVVATCLCGRVEAGFLLEVQQPQQARLLELLDRYHFSEQVQFPVMPAVADEHIATAVGAGEAGVAVADDGAVTIRFARRGVQFARRHAGDGGSAAAVAARELPAAVAECLRMGAGLVAVGVDTEPQTLALEADLDDHCSTTKGCYTGQEIVARIHTYGHTNRALCLLHLAAGPPITAPAVLHEPDDDLPVGRVLHAVVVPEGLAGVAVRRVGLGYLPTDFQRIGTGLRLADGSAVTVAGFARA